MVGVSRVEALIDNGQEFILSQGGVAIWVVALELFLADMTPQLVRIESSILVGIEPVEQCRRGLSSFCLVNGAVLWCRLLQRLRPSTASHEPAPRPP